MANRRTFAYLIVNGEEIPVLATQNLRRGYVLVKIRKPSDTRGFCLGDESLFLSEHPEMVSELRAGKVLCL